MLIGYICICLFFVLFCDSFKIGRLTWINVETIYVKPANLDLLIHAVGIYHKSGSGNKFLCPWLTKGNLIIHGHALNDWSSHCNLSILSLYSYVVSSMYQCMLQYPKKVLNIIIVNILKYHYQYGLSNNTGLVLVFYQNT